MSIRSEVPVFHLVKPVVAMFAGLAVSASLQAAVLEEIVVTAQKREQSLQDVPVSVSVVSGESMRGFSINRMEEMTASLPNVTVAENATQDSLTIRAIGSGANHGFEQSAGTFVDGIYYGRGRSSRSPLLDVERVEVLKGPQGVLFGKNTIAGALNITTRKPTDEFVGFIGADYFFEDNESHSVTGIVSGPMSDSMAGRLVARFANSSGYVENTATGSDEPETEEVLLRGTLVLDAIDNLDVTIKAGYSKHEVDGRHMQLVEGGTHRATYESIDPDYEQKLDYKRQVNNSIFGADYDNTDAYNLSATINYQMENSTLVAVTAFVGYDYDNNIPANFAANVDTATKRYEEEHEQFSQELRLQSDSNNSLEYIVGLYYQTETIDHFQDFLFDTVQSVADGFVPPSWRGKSQFDLEQETDSLAAFGQLTWHGGERFRATLGLRFTDDDKSIDFKQTTTWTVGPLPFPTRTVDDDRNDNEWTPSLNVQFDALEDVMLYAGLSRGFKSGGFDFESGGQFEDETVVAWEAGMKSRLADGAVELNVAVFSSEFEDLQVSAWNGTSFVTGNAAESETQGLEMDIRWQIDENWMLSGALAYLDAEYSDFPAATCTAAQQTRYNSETGDRATNCSQNLSGMELQFAPEWAGTLSLDYLHGGLGNGLELAARVGLDYSDAYFAALDLDPISEQDAYTKVHARIQITSEAGWSVALVGKNLTDEKTTTWVNDVPFRRGAFFGSIDPPRTIGVQVQYEF